MKQNLCLILFILPFCLISGQEEDIFVSGYVEDIIEHVSESDLPMSIESLLSDLEYLNRNPIDLNSASYNDLEKLHMLNDFQIKSFFDYRKRMKQIISVHELNYVYGFNKKIVELITPFVYCGLKEKKNRKGLKEILKHDKHEAVLFASTNNSDATDYMGSGLQHYLKYSASFSNRLQIGVIGEKDYGEKLEWSKEKPGYDFYSGHLQLTTPTVFNRIIVGDYKVRLGQGVLIWNGFSSGKSVEMSPLIKRGQGISGNTSKDEYNFMRGGAAMLSKNKLSLLLWCSKKNIDGINDSLNGNTIIRNIITSGYHRSETEVERRNNTNETTLGASLSYKKTGYRLGINMMHTKYSYPLIPFDKPYLVNHFRGKDYQGMSIDYKFLFQCIQMYGELAYSNSGLALLTGIHMMPKSNLTSTVFYRYYQSEYYAAYANAVLESGDVSNEKGFFGGINWNAGRGLILSAYTDIFSFPWLTYQTNRPANGSEYLVQLQYNYSPDVKITLRYKNKTKEKNYVHEEWATKIMRNFIRQNARIHIRYKLSDKLVMANRLAWSESGFSASEKYNGFLLYQDLEYKIYSTTLASFRYARFHTENYEARIYAYEKDILYSFSIPSYHGEGQKLYAMIHQKIGRRFQVWLRYAFTHYYNTTKMNKHEFRGQLMLKF